MKWIFIYRNSGAGGEGGSSLSLDDLDKEDDSPEKKDDLEKKVDLDPEETDEEREARELAEKDQAEKDKKKDEKKDDDDPEKKPEEKPAGDPEAEDDAEAFFKDVDALAGEEEPLDVDYGDIDPLSPQGIVLRDKAVEDRAISRFETHLEERYPKAYGYLLHVSAGKPEEEFFGKDNTNLETLPTVEEIEASVEVQKNMVMQNLIAKGNSDKHAQALIKLAIEDNELEELAKQALTERTAARQTELDKIKDENDKALQVKQASINEMNTYVDALVSTGKIGNIVIPEKDRAAFAKHVKDSIRYENGKFVIVSELNQATAEKTFGKEYFSYKGGNLGTIVQQAAKTENALRLKRTIPVPNVPKSRGGGEGGKVVTLSEIDTD